MAQSYEEFGSGPEHAETPHDGWVTDNRPTDAGMGGTSSGEASARSVADQLSALLQSADGTARRIIEEAEAKARDQLAEVDRRARRVEAEAARLAAWSRQTEKLIQTMWSAFSEFRRDVETIPQRINEVLAPLASHASVVVRQIDNLTNALGSQTSEKATGPSPLPPDPTHFAGPMPFDTGPSDGSVPSGGVGSWEDLANGTP
jgi:vacuolar-type H+-ATPase subunit H